jgi:vacuolar-type H+-ATPase subunit F/Vma7
MNRSVRILASPEVAAGFSLAGLQATGVTDLPGAAELLTKELDRPETGVVLLEDRFYEGLPEGLRTQLARRPLPLVVPIPGPTWAPELEEAEAYVVELLRRAIGYRVRLK